MEDEMDTLQIEDNVEHQLSLEASCTSGETPNYPRAAPRIGSEHQAEIPNLATEDERRQLMVSPLYSSNIPVYDCPSVVGLAIPIIWASHPSSEVDANKDKLHSLEAESRMGNIYMDTQVTSFCSNFNVTSECDSTHMDPHAALPLDQTEFPSNPVYDEKSSPYFTQELLDLSHRPMVQQSETEQFTLLPGLSVPIWNNLEEECLLLGLYIFGKDLSLLSKFVGSKTVVDMLSYYYGRFYNSDAYKRWSHCRKTKTTRCILGQSIFTGRRQQELVSRLKSKFPKEAHHSLVEVLKSCGEKKLDEFGKDDLKYLAEHVFALKSLIGPETFVEVIGIGKGKYDLTGFVQDTSKTNHVRSVCGNIPKGVKCSTLATEDIVRILTGDFRKSKQKLNELFWEAVWPRLLARGWHSEQPDDVRTTKNRLVFLLPGVKKFSRKKLTKGTNYFDSFTDVLKKVTSDPTLLEPDIDATLLEPDIDGIENGQAADQDGPLDCDQELPKFTIVDTSLVLGEEPFNARQLRSLPADANISFGPSYHSDDMSSDSSWQELDGNDSSSGDHEDRGRVRAHGNDNETFSLYNKINEPHVVFLESMGTAPCSVFPVNGHSSNDQHLDISSGNGDKIDFTCFSDLGTETGRLVYLSPKRRRAASCSNEHSSRQSYSSSNDDGLEKHKSKPLPTSSKPAVVDLGGSFQTRTLANYSTKEKPLEEISNVVKSNTNGGPHKKSNTERINEAPLSEGKVDAKIHPKIKINRGNLAKEGMQASGLIDLNKRQTLPGDETSKMTSSENHGSLQANENGSPSISNSEMVPDVVVTAGKPDPAVQINPLRHGTRNRPPTAKALEAVALGLLGGTKRKGDSKSLKTNRPPQRSRKNKD